MVLVQGCLARSPPLRRSRSLTSPTAIFRYNATIWGPSGNITINGTLTFGNASASASAEGAHAKRGLGAAAEPDVNLNSPPYAIHNGT